MLGQCLKCKQQLCNLYFVNRLNVETGLFFCFLKTQAHFEFYSSSTFQKMQDRINRFWRCWHLHDVIQERLCLTHFACILIASQWKMSSKMGLLQFRPVENILAFRNVKTRQRKSWTTEWLKWRKNGDPCCSEATGLLSSHMLTEGFIKRNGDASQCETCCCSVCCWPQIQKHGFFKKQ